MNEMELAQATLDSMGTTVHQTGLQSYTPGYSPAEVCLKVANDMDQPTQTHAHNNLYNAAGCPDTSFPDTNGRSFVCRTWVTVMQLSILSHKGWGHPL